MPLDEFKELKQRSLFAKLKRLFNTDVIVRNVGGKKLKVVDTHNLQFSTDRQSQRDRFNKIRTSNSNLYTRDFTLSYQSSRIELFRDYDCVGEDTIIPLPDGTRPTIKELAEKYKDKPQERFPVFSYDYKTDSIKLGQAFHPRKKVGGARDCWKIILDNGKFIIGSEKHPFLMRDCTYKRVCELKVGDSVMPFYQNEYGYKKHGFKRYRKLYNFSNGWQSEHKIVAEQFQRKLKKNEVVHHKDIDGSNNSPDNLQIMDWDEHQKFHSEYNKNILWGDENYEIQLNKLKSNPNYINRRIHKWNGERAGKNNPFSGKHHTTKSNEIRSKSLIETFKGRDQTGNNNPGYRSDLTLNFLKMSAQEFYKLNNKLTIHGLANYVGCDYETLQSRLSTDKITWRNFKTEIVESLNHKIVAIEYAGKQEVYDVTVDEYHNFATDSCFVSNTMDMDPIISSALDIFSDESLTPSELGNVLTIVSPNENIREILHNLFYDILNIEFNLWSWTRNLVKYGDAYLKLYISPEYGVYRVEPLGSYNVVRVENSTDDKNYVKFQVNLPEGGKIEELEDYEVAHFRLLSDSNFAPYGKSIIEGARRVWKQVNLMEDSMLIHRVMRAPTKRIFKVDVGNIPPNEVDQYMEKTINKTKKIPYVDEATGDYNLRFNLQNMVEDFYLPVRGSDSGTSIDTLEGMTFTGIDDIEYLRNKLMSALKIPKAFLGYDADVSGKATLAAEDVRFARTIGRIQRIIVSELTKIAIVHLFSQGYQDEELIDFKLELTNPSTIFEKEKISVWQEKISLADDALENNIFSRKWLYKNVFKMSDDDVATMENDIVDDVKQTFRHTQIKEEGIDPAKEFNKMSTKTDSGDDEDNLGDEGGEGENMDAALGDADGGTPPVAPEAPKTSEPPIAEKAAVRDQTGRKDARDYPYGEDPLGSQENNRKPNKTTKKSAITHTFSKKSPLYLEKLEKFVESAGDGKMELIQELENLEIHPKTPSQVLDALKSSLPSSRMSFLDESIILDNNV